MAENNGRKGVELEEIKVVEGFIELALHREGPDGTYKQMDWMVRVINRRVLFHFFSCKFGMG